MSADCTCVSRPAVVTLGSDDSSGSDEQAQKLSRNQIKHRLRVFVEETDTTETQATVYLKQHDWDVLSAVEHYRKDLVARGPQTEMMDPSPLDPSGYSASTCQSIVSSTNVVDLSSDDDDDDSPVDTDAGVRTMQSVCDRKPEGCFLRFVTWNIDGLDQRNREVRTRGACKVVRDENADIVFFQEVVEDTEKIIRQEMNMYTIHSGQVLFDMPESYYTLTLIKNGTVKSISSQVIPYLVTMMIRNILHVKVRVGDVTLHLVNTHLESTKSSKAVRVKQLAACFKLSEPVSAEEPIIIAGDLNLRDQEVVRQ